MIDFYKAIFRATGSRQIGLFILSIAVAGLAAVPIEYQKNIINGLGQGLDAAELVRLGVEMGGVILLSLVLKWLLGYRSGLVSEWVIRRLRQIVCEGQGHQGDAPGDSVGKGTLSSMVSAESEIVGKFVGDSVAQPVVQFGTLVSIIGYIAGTEPELGLLVMAFVLPQAMIVFLSQSRINGLVRERVLILRQAVDRLSDGQIAEIREALYDDFDKIYEARRHIFIWKLSTKFLLSALNGLGLVLVLMLGGWLVIHERSDVGTVVAATVGLHRTQQPWRLMIAFYRNLSAVRVQWELMREAIEQLRYAGGP